MLEIKTLNVESEKTQIVSFLVRLVSFIALFLLVLSSGFSYKNAIPNLLNAQADKHELLKKALSPKIVILGGSNASFGFNSELIAKAFNMPVINMGVYAEIGFRYMIKDIEPFIKKSDIIILVPEYGNFVSDLYYGSRGLVAVVFDVFPEGIKFLSFQQWVHLAPYMLNYAAVKVKRIPGFLTKNLFPEKKKNQIGIYDRESFNQYGDACAHWSMEPRQIAPFAKVAPGSTTINQVVLDELKELKNKIEAEGAKYIILPPCLQKRSYDNQQIMISEIASAVATPYYKPNRYVFEDRLCFDSPYHLIKEGVDKRTQLVIEDVKSILQGNFDHK